MSFYCRGFLKRAPLTDAHWACQSFAQIFVQRSNFNPRMDGKVQHSPCQLRRIFSSIFFSSPTIYFFISDTLNMLAQTQVYGYTSCIYNTPSLPGECGLVVFTTSGALVGPGRVRYLWWGKAGNGTTLHPPPVDISTAIDSVNMSCKGPRKACEKQQACSMYGRSIQICVCAEHLSCFHRKSHHCVVSLSHTCERLLNAI